MLAQDSSVSFDSRDFRKAGIIQGFIKLAFLVSGSVGDWDFKDFAWEIENSSQVDNSLTMMMPIHLVGIMKIVRYCL